MPLDDKVTGEVSLRMYRAYGRCVCACGDYYRNHPTEKHAWAFAAEDVAVFHRLCNGDLVKL